MVDVVVVGGGPAGLQSALTLARGQRSVVVVDAGPARNARAVEVHTFLTRDGTPPRELRAHAHAELARYGVEIRQARAIGIDGERGRFTVRLEDGAIDAARVVLANGMVDVLPPIPGYEALWGHAIFACPYCHGHEVRGQRFGAHVTAPGLAELALLLTGWTRDIVAFTDGLALDDATRDRLARAGVAVEEAPIASIVGDGEHLRAVALEGGREIARDVVFARPAQRQTPFVAGLGLELDAAGFVVVDDHRQTSRPGIYAAGDLISPMQSAIVGAAAGMAAGAMLNHELTIERALAGA